VENLENNISKWRILGSPTEKAIMEMGLNFQINLEKLKIKTKE